MGLGTSCPVLRLRDRPPPAPAQRKSCGSRGRAPAVATRSAICLAGLDQVAGETIVCKLVSVGHAHFAVSPMDKAFSAMSIEELEPLFS